MTMDDGSRARLEAARAGAGWALAELYHELHPRVLRYLRAMEPSEHEDLAADVWLETSHALQRFEGDEAGLRGLAFTIARRRVLDLRRRRARRGTSPVPQEQLVSTEAGDAEEDAMASLSTDEALRQILRLPPDQAQVILLRVIADLPVAEVASILEKTPGAVRALQHRAVRRLARQTSREAVTP